MTHAKLNYILVAAIHLGVMGISVWIADDQSMKMSVSLTLWLQKLLDYSIFMLGMTKLSKRWTPLTDVCDIYGK